MNNKLKELKSQIAQNELAWRECSSKLLYVDDYVNELLQQIDKMKCCNNCKFSHQTANSGDSYCELKDEWTHEKCEKWEIY